MSDITAATLDALVLAEGSHGTRESGLCAMEAVAWLAGEPHSDHPACTCPVIARYVIRLNDRMRDDERQRLKAYLPRLIGTRATPEVERRRMFVFADWAVRKIAPIALRARGRAELAEKLEAVAEINSEETAEAGRAVARTAYAAAYAAAAAAADAAAAAAAAADAAARSKVWDVALQALDAAIAVQP